MPINKDAFTRYRLIDERLRRRPHPSLEDLIAHVGEHLDRPVSKRTVQLDLQEMRYSQSLKFEAPIVFDRGQRSYGYSDPGYSINNLPVTADDLHGLEFAISLLDQFKGLPAIREFEEAIMKIAETVRFNKQSRGEESIIQFDRPNSYKGIEYIEHAVRAIREKRRIRLTYQKFGEQSTKVHIIEPYVVREFKSRFYLIGNVTAGPQTTDNGRRTAGNETSAVHGPASGKVKTYAFDRFVDMQVTDITFSGGEFDSEKYFQNVFGITEGDSGAETVLLSFHPVQGKYVQSQPLHHSQKVIKETDTECQVSLRVMINTELVMQLLSYGAGVKVLKPDLLAEKIKSELKKSIAKYK